jgi:flagellar M-ring protein FliF
VNQQVRQLLEKFLAWWAKHDARQKRNIILITVMAVLCISVLSWFLLRPNYVPIYSGQDAKSAGEITTKLDSLKISYQTQGNTILVPAQDADKVKMQLALAGLPKTGSVTYQDIFNSNNFGMTEDQFNLETLAALQSDLANTIQTLDGIENADVHIVMPEKHLFVDQQTQDAKASVVLQLAPGTQLIPAQVAGIQQLVAHSVQGLTPANVSVVDQTGVRLNATDDGSDGTDGSVEASKELQIRSQIEDSTAAKIRDGLERMFGVGNVSVNVHADVNFDQVTSQSHTVTPVLKGATGLPVSEQSSSTTSNNGQGAIGVPGTQTNVTGTTTSASSTNNNSTYSQTSNTTNYDYNKTDTKTVQDPFKIQKYTVSVLINGSLSQQSIDQVKQYIATSIGQQNNGSSNNDITVASAKFQTAANPFTGTKAWYQNPYLIGAGLLGLVLAAGGLILVARRRKQEDEFDEEPILATPAPVVPVEETEHQKVKKELDKLASQKPEEFANLLRTWLAEE